MQQALTTYEFDSKKKKDDKELDHIKKNMMPVHIGISRTCVLPNQWKPIVQNKKMLELERRQWRLKKSIEMQCLNL